ncbi:MAG TPA: glycosyltransferase [Chitinophagaceae bacterium]
MKKLLHIIDSLAVGGAEKLLVGIINGLEQYEHHLILLKGPEILLPQLRQDLSFNNLQCHSFAQLFTKIPVVKKYIREHKIDIVHSHLYESNLLARLSTPRSVSLVNSIHAISSLASYKVNRMSLYMEKLTYKKRHVVVAVSKTVLEDFDEWVGLKGNKHVLYNFIEEKFFQPFQEKPGLPDGRLKLVAVGNLRWQKNYPYLLEAFKKIPEGVTLDIYGEGGLKANLQQQIDTYHLPIKLCGTHYDMEKVLPTYDAFVMSSFYEGQPVSLLEAMASGLPAILSDIPVLREVNEDKAIYFDIDNTDSFVSVIKAILDGKYNLAGFARAGHQRVNEFAHRQQYLEQLLTIYKKLPG